MTLWVKFWHLLVFVCALVISGVSVASSKHVSFLSEITPPFYWQDENGKPQGVNVDLANALAPLLPFSSSLEHMPWARAYQEALSKPDFVLLTLLKTSKREPLFQWISPINHVEASLIRLKENQTLSLTDLEEAKEYRVGTIRGCGSESYLRQKGFEENKNLILTAEPPQLWSLLYYGRIDFVLSNLEIGAYEISSAGLDPSKAITELNIAPLSAELHVATGLMTEKSEVEAIKEALNTLKKSGEYQRIMRKWGLKPFATAP